MRLSWKEIRACAAKFTDEWWRKGKTTGGFWIVAWVVFVLVASVVFSAMFWDWLSVEESNGTIIRKSGSDIIRNLGLVIATIVALPLAIWRSIVAERQATASQLQAETAQRSLLNERYQKGAEMLGSEMLQVRLGGIYALARLAREYPEEYHTQIMQLFCAFVRIPPERTEKSATADGEEQATLLREDAQAVMTAIGKRRSMQIFMERQHQYELDLAYVQLPGAILNDANLSGASLSGANLVGADLRDAKLFGAILARADLVNANLTGADLSRAHLNGAKLSNARLSRADLTSADLNDADLSYTNLTRADLTDAILISTNLTHANLSGCNSLTQEQLNDAIAHEAGPPMLTDAVDAKIGVPLVWPRNHA